MSASRSAQFWHAVQRWRQRGRQRAVVLSLVMLIVVGLGSCDRPSINTTPLLDIADGAQQSLPLQGRLSEVSPPETIQALKPFLEVYEPQVQILTPREGAILKDTAVTVQVRVRDLPIYTDPDLGLGPHFHLVLDDQPGQDIYDADATISFDNLAPGTHTLRAFAARPWHESFKNEGAFDQVTFNVFTPSSKNDVGRNAPLLTYSQPQGAYGSEPILLDFHLRNVPLHLIAAGDDSIRDWRIRCTVNDESFVFDRWQPLYLKGFSPGQNWVKLELIDETGQLFPGPFNSAIGVVEYRPGESDPLSNLIRGEIPVDIARVLVDPTYEPPAPTTSETLLDRDDLSNSEVEQQSQKDEARNEDNSALPDSETQPELVEVEEVETDNLETERLETEAQEANAVSPMPQTEVMSSDERANSETMLPPDSTTPGQSRQATDEPASGEATAQNEKVSNPDATVEPSTEPPTPELDASDFGDVLPASPDEEIEFAPAGEQDATVSKSTTELENPSDSDMPVLDANRPGLSALVE